MILRLRARRTRIKELRKTLDRLSISVGRVHGSTLHVQTSPVGSTIPFVKPHVRCQRVKGKQSTKHLGRWIISIVRKPRVKVSTRHSKAKESSQQITSVDSSCSLTQHRSSTSRSGPRAMAQYSIAGKVTSVEILDRQSCLSAGKSQASTPVVPQERTSDHFHFNSGSACHRLDSSPFISGSSFTIQSFISATKFTIAIRQSESRNQGFLKKHHSIGKLQQHHRSTTKILASGSVGEYIVSHLRRV